MRIRLRGLTVALLVVALSLAGCGGNDADGGNGSNGEELTPTQVELAGDAAAFLALLESSLSSTFTVTYTTMTDEGPGDAFVVTSAPPQARVDTIPVDTSEPLSAIVVDSEGRTIGCGDGPDNWECVEINPLGDSVLNAAGPVVYYSAADLLNFNITEIDSRDLVGEWVRCFLLAPTDDGAEGDTTYCVADDGLPLFTESPFGTVEATDLSRTISEDAFTLPAELPE